MQQASWPLNAQIYQVFVGRWSKASLLHHEGQVFNKLINHQWEAPKSLGINTIYLLGIFENSGPLIVPDENGVDLTTVSHRLPSPFAITNHTALNPILGDENSFKKLINHLHNLELRVIVDFVPNHTGLNHPWLKEHPEYYHQTPDGPVTEFSADVAKLNYDNQNLVNQMIGVLEAISKMGVDGVRCDMAHLVPTSFWSQAINQIKSQHPQFTFIAEAYAKEISDLSILDSLHSAGFELIYHEPLYRNLRKVLKDNEPLEYLVGHLSHTLSQNQLPWLHYLSNHDDGVIEDKEYFESQFALIALLKGPKLWYNGVFQGHTKRLAHHYYQELNEENLNVSKLATPIKKLLNTQKEGVSISDIYHDTNLIICELKPSGKLLLNLSPQPLTIPDTIEGSGRLHHYTHGDQLPSGQAELFREPGNPPAPVEKTAEQSEASTENKSNPSNLKQQAANRSLKTMLDMNG